MLVRIIEQKPVYLRAFLSKFQFFHSFWFKKWRDGQPESVILYKQITYHRNKKLDRASNRLLFDREYAILLITTGPPDCLGRRWLTTVIDCFLCFLALGPLVPSDFCTQIY